MIPYHVQSLAGIWSGGWALDLHTAAAAGGYRRTPLGEALYRLKYGQDCTQVEPIARVAALVLGNLGITPRVSAIIPVPPSDTTRRVQPVVILAERIGALTGLPVLATALVKVKPTPPLKNVSDTASRRQALSGAFRANTAVLAGRPVLLLDDLYRSGETLTEAARTLTVQGGVPQVYVLTITKTRSLR